MKNSKLIGSGGAWASLVMVAACSSIGQYSSTTSAAIELCEQAAESEGHDVKSVTNASSHGDGAADVIFAAQASDGTGEPYVLACHQDSERVITLSRSEG